MALCFTVLDYYSPRVITTIITACARMPIMGLNRVSYMLSEFRYVLDSNELRVSL